MKINCTLRLIMAAILSHFILQANGQIVGGDAFLRGHAVEVGIGHLGYYGSDAAPPAGYHQHCPTCFPTTNLGFVADPLATGWNTSTASPTSHYMGDYFLPGSPYEGWELQVNGARCIGDNAGSSSSVFSYAGGMGTCTGSNTSYAVSGSIVTATWQGFIDSITLIQTTMVDTNDLYFMTKITLINTAHAPKNGIYYFRGLDPDNDESWTGGGFPTKNVITYQCPNPHNESVVTATGYSDPSAFLALGSADTNSRVLIFSFWPLSSLTDLAPIYGRTYAPATYTPGSHNDGDIGIGIVFSIPHLATVDSAADSVLRITSGSTLHSANTASFSFFYAFDTAAVDSAVANGHRTPAPDTTLLAIRNINKEADIKIYPNPTTSLVNISGLSGGERMQVYDMMGRQVMEKLITIAGVNTISLQNQPPGSYLMVITDSVGNVRKRTSVRKY